MESSHLIALISLFLVLVLPIDGHREENSNCGQISKNSSNPWHVAIYHHGRYQCGGTVIGSNLILTAAQCVSMHNEPMDAKEVSVDLGRQNLGVDDSSIQHFEVAEIIAHPDFQSTELTNDIAIVRLSSNVVFNEYVQPICLWQPDKKDLSEVVDRAGTVIGWGTTDSGKISDELIQLHAPVVSFITCLQSNREFAARYLSNTNFCAGSRNGTSLATGMAGGSLSFVENNIYYIRGIASLCPAKINHVTQQILCDSKEYSIFTDTAQYLSWIEMVTMDNGESVQDNVMSTNCTTPRLCCI